MRKRKRSFNFRLIRAEHPYSIPELAEAIRAHPQTVSRWVKEGMTVLDRATKPYLIMGEAAREFLKAQQSRRRRKLEIDQLFCPRCREARRSRPEGLKVEVLDKRLGPTFKLALIRGLCEVCGTRMIRFSSDHKAQGFLDRLGKGGVSNGIEFEVIHPEGLKIANL